MEYPEWKAPAEDRAIVLWPEAPQLISDVRGNHQSLRNAQVRVGNVPLGELRRKQREWLGHDDAKLMIASGHQTELYHSGVWAKDVLTNVVAEKVEGSAYHFSVDTDQPKHLLVRWPARGGVQSFAITDDSKLNSTQWAGLLDAPSPAHVDQIQRALAKSGLTFEPVVGEFLSSVKRLALETPGLAAALTNAIHELNWGLGLRHHAMLCSPIWGCEPYLVFVHHVLGRAREFAADYNTALAEYRREKKVRTASRPMPDLNLTATSIEVPFWLDDLANGTRERGSVWLDAQGKVFLVAPGGQEMELNASRDGWETARELAGFLRRNNLRLSPRALTLTLFLRLLVADGFVHGIGGGRYDQVTDRLIQAHFGIEPPKFAVTTATMYFPDAVGRTRACLPCVKRDGHRLKHSLLGERKRELVEAIAAAPRRSLERRSLFGALRRELGQAMAGDARIEAWQRELLETQRQAGEEKVLFDRELFFAMQSRERLTGLIGKYATLV